MFNKECKELMTLTLPCHYMTGKRDTVNFPPGAEGSRSYEVCHLLNIPIVLHLSVMKLAMMLFQQITYSFKSSLR